MSDLHTSLEIFLGHEAYTDNRERQLQAFADAIPLIVWTANPNGELDYYNRQWEIYTGLSATETAGGGWGPVLHPDDSEPCIKRWTEAFTTGEPYEIEYRFKRAQDSCYRWHLGRATPFKDDNGMILKWFGTATDIDDQAGNQVGALKIMSQTPNAFNERDIQTLQLMAGLVGAAIGHQADFETNRKLLQGRMEALDALKTEIEHRSHIEATIRDNEWRTRMIIESSYDAFVAINQHGEISDWNQQAEKIFGWSRQEALGAVLADLIIPEQYRQTHSQGMQHFMATGKGAVLNKPIELLGLRRGGEEFPVELTIRAMQFKEGYEFCAFLRDITERKTLAKLSQRSHSDPLTGAANCHIFNDRIDEAIKRCIRNKTRLALLRLDIDRFEEIYDEYGDRIGDSVLKEFSQRVRKVLRASDTLARMGDDKFVVILEDLKYGVAAETVAHKILDAIRTNMQVDAQQFTVTTTVGVAYYSDEPNPEQLLDKADKAMYRAKQAGRNRVSV